MVIGEREISLIVPFQHVTSFKFEAISILGYFFWSLFFFFFFFFFFFRTNLGTHSWQICHEVVSSRRAWQLGRPMWLPSLFPVEGWTRATSFLEAFRLVQAGLSFLTASMLHNAEADAPCFLLPCHFYLQKHLLFNEITFLSLCVFFLDSICRQKRINTFETEGIETLRSMENREISSMNFASPTQKSNRSTCQVFRDVWVWR